MVEVSTVIWLHRIVLGLKSPFICCLEITSLRSPEVVSMESWMIEPIASVYKTSKFWFTESLLMSLQAHKLWWLTNCWRSTTELLRYSLQRPRLWSQEHSWQFELAWRIILECFWPWESRSTRFVLCGLWERYPRKPLHMCLYNLQNQPNWVALFLCSLHVGSSELSLVLSTFPWQL